MKSFQKITAALEKKVPDEVPVLEFVIDSHVIEALYPGCDYIDFAGAMGLDAVAVRPTMKKETITPDTIRDERGFIARRTTQDYFEPISHPIRDEKDLKKYEFPDPHASHRLRDLTRAVKKYKGDLDGFLKGLKDHWNMDSMYDQEKGIILIATQESSSCGCPLIDTEKVLDEVCNCSIGWQKQTFETVLGKDVDVEIKESIIRGGKRCAFEIRILG